MARLQALALVAAVLLLSGFAWLHEHDAKIRHKVESQHRADSLAFDAKQIEGLRESLVNLNKVHQEQKAIYDKRNRVLRDSLPKLESHIDKLIAEIDSVLPDGHKLLAPAVAQACKEQADMIMTQLILCDALRKQADYQIQQRDTIIWRLQNSRDGYKQSYESERKQNINSGMTKVYATVGKVSIFATVTATVGHLFHLW